MLWSLFYGLFATGLGVAFYVLVPSWIAAVVVGWTVWESIRLCRASWRHREAMWGYVAPRAVGTVLAFAIAYLVFVPWARVIVLAYLLLLLLEGGYRLVLQRFRPAMIRAARQVVDPNDDPAVPDTVP